MVIAGLSIGIGLILLAAYIFVFVVPNRPGSAALNGFRTSACKLIGGQMRTAGCGLGGCTYNCHLPYRDGGKKCSSPQGCSGSCIVTKPQINDWFSKDHVPNQLKGCTLIREFYFACPNLDIETACQTWPAANCEFLWTFEDGVIHPVMSQKCSI